MRNNWANDIIPMYPSIPDRYAFVRNRESKTLACLHGCREVLQGVLSQAGSHLVTGVFHDGERFSIGKAEGGFLIPSCGEFIPTGDAIMMDSFRAKISPREAVEAAGMLTNLLSQIVLKWDPARHEDSLYEVAAELVGKKPAELRARVEASPEFRVTMAWAMEGKQFVNPISYFFGWNNFDQIPCDRSYRTFWLNSSPVARSVC